jgi:anti-sigma factor RsiW
VLRQPPDSPLCSEVLDRLEALLDGELESGEAGRLRAHLERCELCRDEHQLAVEIREGLRMLPVLRPPARVTVAVKAAVGNNAGPRRLVSKVWLVPGLAAAALAAAVTLAVVLGPFHRAPQPAQATAEARRAAADTRLALAVLANATRRAEGMVRGRMLDDGALKTTVRGLSRSLSWLPDRSAGATAPGSVGGSGKERSL